MVGACTWGNVTTCGVAVKWTFGNCTALGEYLVGSGHAREEDHMLMFVMPRHRVDQSFTLTCGKETGTVTRQGCSVEESTTARPPVTTGAPDCNESLRNTSGIVLEDMGNRVTLVSGYGHVLVGLNLTAFLWGQLLSSFPTFAV